MAIAPVGTIVAYAGKTAPKGWLLCDGSVIPSDAAHKALTSLVGTNTPNLQGYFLRGLDPTGKVDPEKDRKLLSAQQDGVGPHTHTYTNWFHNQAGKSGAGSPDMPADNNSGPTGPATPTPGETRPKNIAVNFIIKAIDEG